MTLVVLSARERSLVRITPQGVLSRDGATQLHLAIAEIITRQQADNLQVSLASVTALAESGLNALVAGYVLAVDYGVRYRVIDAKPLRRSWRTTVVLDALADSDDMSALLAALTALAHRGRPGSPA